jgi:hypothetical protein
MDTLGAMTFEAPGIPDRSPIALEINYIKLKGRRSYIPCSIAVADI